VVHGRWIYESVEFTYKKDIKCSVCSRYVDEPENYCPNCGAKMDGERKDNDYDNY
jgi:rRNA maturation endonuclease Nob1